MAGFLGRLLRNENASVAPTVALSLVALIAAGGIAFDYARVAAMDSELQAAADQAALAAASQLDGQSGACARASAAASNVLSQPNLLTNRSLFASGSDPAVRIPNEGTGTGPSDGCDTIGQVRFYQSYSYDPVTHVEGVGADATTFAQAKVVVVEVSPRQAVYALTPIVGAFRSGNISAQAIASLGSAICKMPPVMICNPEETGGNTSFNATNYIGKGLRLTSVGNGSGSWAPGNFGYLDTGGGSNGAPGLREALGWVTPPGNCVSATGVDTKPGATVDVTDSLNTRFDIYDNVACPSGGACPASINSTKDIVRSANAGTNGNGCRMHNSGWGEAANDYYTMATSNAALNTTSTPDAMGYPRDICHAWVTNGTCANGRIGDGNWDRDAYFRVNYKRSGTPPYWDSATWQAQTGLSPTVTPEIPGTNMPNPAYASRYNVYAWEIAHRTQTIAGVTVLAPQPPGATGSTKVAYGEPICSPAQGFGAGQIPDSTTPDRRRISVAVVNCMANNVRGNSVGVPVEKWIDVFLVEPSLNRQSGKTNAGDIYAEVVAETQSGGNGTVSGQVIKRDVPFLIR